VRKLVAFLAGLLGVGCSRPAPVTEEAVPKSGLVITCSPNPCDQHTHPTVPQPPYPYMWFYRTEVRNTLDVPLRITRFEAYVQQGGRWVARNITGRSLTAQDFGEWYPDGVKVVDGMIPPGGVAVDVRNWHGSSAPTNGPTKWAYWAVDPSGAEHYAEVVVESVPVRR
jgi:hypothetical protein